MAAGGFGAATAGAAQEETALLHPQENEMTNLTHAIIEWRKLSDEIAEHKQEIKERSKKQKALEEIILRVMKNHNIGALDLKNSGGRVLYKQQKRQSGLGAKALEKYLGDYLKSADKGKEAMAYIQEHRDIVTKESLSYQVLDA
jgi:hypothetical protein